MRSRRLLAAALTLVAASVLSACSDDEPEGGPTGEPGDAEDAGLTSGGEPDDPAGAAKPDVTFRSTIASSGSSVVVTYTLVNHSNLPVLVPNQLPDSAGRYDDGRQTVYVTGSGETAATISQRVFATPDTDRVSWSQSPRVGVSTLPGGGVLSVDLEVPLPLVRRAPFGDDLGYGPIELPDPVDSVRFCIGVVPMPFEPAYGVVRADGVRTIAHGDASNAGQHVFCSDETGL